MEMQTLARECWQTSEDKGWHDEERTFGDRISLIHSECSEALEEFRDNKGFDTYWNGEKPEGIPIELADVIIRVLDMAEEYNIDIVDALELKLAFNKTRPFRHGGKKL